MPVSVHWPSKVISVPKSYLASLGGNVYELDLDQFRLDLKDLEDGEQGISYLDTHKRAAPVTLAGATYAQKLEIVNGYTITFENGTYAVNLVGANSNVSQVVNTNQVSVRSFNSPGLIEVAATGGGGGTTVDLADDLVTDAELELVGAASSGTGSVGTITPTTRSDLPAIVAPGAPAVIYPGQGAVVQ